MEKSKKRARTGEMTRDNSKVVFSDVYSSKELRERESRILYYVLVRRLNNQVVKVSPHLSASPNTLLLGGACVFNLMFVYFVCLVLYKSSDLMLQRLLLCVGSSSISIIAEVPA